MNVRRKLGRACLLFCSSSARRGESGHVAACSGGRNGMRPVQIRGERER